MKQKKYLNKRLALSFILISILTILGNVELFEHMDFVQNNPLPRYTLYFFWIILIAVTGYIGWKTYLQKWVQFMWIATYIAGIAILIILAVIDLFVYKFPDNIRWYIVYFRSILVSPVPFVIFYLLVKLTAGSTSNNFEVTVTGKDLEQ